MTSVVICCFDFTRVLRHMTQRCIADIRRFTDDEDYELIVVDNVPTIEIKDDFKVNRFDDIKWIINQEDKGYYAALNQGAEIATGEYLVFIQPDVFVHEDWLPNMRYYLENDLYDVVYPDQFPQTREKIKQRYEMSFEDATAWGGREAGCLMITRKGFDKTGGWDDRLWNEYGEAAFYNRIDKAGLRWASAGKSLITHVTAGTRYTMWNDHPEIHNKDMEHDGALWGVIRHE